MLASPRRVLPIFVASALLGLFIYGYITVPGDNGWVNSWQTMDSATYVKDALHDKVYGGPEEPTWDGIVGDKIIVMAKMAHENTSWVEQKLPDWQRAIYVVPANKEASYVLPPASTPPSTLSLPANKGNEAMAYLTYLIDFYDHLPATLLFLHAHEAGYHEAWHVDARLHSNVVATRELRLDTLASRGYVSMRCNPRSNCLRRPGLRHPSPLTRDVWEAFWAHTSTPAPRIDAIVAERHDIDEADPTMPLDPQDTASDPSPPIAAPPGAQFAVTREAVRSRPREDYVALREWLLATDMDDSVSGRILEYQWHILFGMPGVMCYDRSACECDVFGRC